MPVDLYNGRKTVVVLLLLFIQKAYKSTKTLTSNFLDIKQT